MDKLIYDVRYFLCHLVKYRGLPVVWHGGSSLEAKQDRCSEKGARTGARTDASWAVTHCG